jgi:hypothetical protein
MAKMAVALIWLRRCSPALSNCSLAQSSTVPGRPQQQDLAVQRGRRPWRGAGPDLARRGHGRSQAAAAPVPAPCRRWRTSYMASASTSLAARQVSYYFATPSEG